MSRADIFHAFRRTVYSFRNLRRLHLFTIITNLQKEWRFYERLCEMGFAVGTISTNSRVRDRGCGVPELFRVHIKVVAGGLSAVSSCDSCLTWLRFVDGIKGVLVPCLLEHHLFVFRYSFYFWDCSC